MMQTWLAPEMPLSSRTMRRKQTLGITTDAVPDIGVVVQLVAANLAARTRLLVTFVNPSSYIEARRQTNYASRLGLFDVVLPDGSGMSMAIRLVHRIPARRISFDTTSLAPAVMALAQQGQYTVALVGGAPGSAGCAMSRLLKEFPMLRLVGAFHGYADIETRALEIAGLNPDIVVCGMGAGKQESLLLALADAGWNGCGFTCGGYLDQLGNGFTYYPHWVDSMNLRWAYRLAKEPRRLWRRYLLEYPTFVIALVFEIWHSFWKSSGDIVIATTAVRVDVRRAAVGDKDFQTGAPN